MEREMRKMFAIKIHCLYLGEVRKNSLELFSFIFKNVKQHYYFRPGATWMGTAIKRVQNEKNTL